MSSNVSLDDYRVRCREWLRANVSALPEASRRPDDREPSELRLSEARSIQRTLFDAGFSGISFDRRWGGQGLSYEHERVFMEEAAGFDIAAELFAVSINIIGRTIERYGNDDQRDRHLPSILAGERIWIQLLSEPSGGSDLAGLRTRATRDGGQYRLSGQKVWSTGARFADHAICPARTRGDVPKHAGISVFLVDLASDGMTIRPIRMIDGGAEFCEEFLDDVIVAAGERLGDENDGWRVMRGMLGIEHEWVGRRGGRSALPVGVDDLRELAVRNGRDGDPAIARRIAEQYADQAVQRSVAQRVSLMIAAGLVPAGYSGILKMARDGVAQRRAELALELAGDLGVAWLPETGDGRWALDFLASRALSIQGGTTEIQKNNVSENGLGMPREPSFDRDVPFDELIKRLSADTPAGQSGVDT